MIPIKDIRLWRASCGAVGRHGNGFVFMIHAVAERDQRSGPRREHRPTITEESKLI